MRHFFSGPARAPRPARSRSREPSLTRGGFRAMLAGAVCLSGCATAPRSQPPLLPASSRSPTAQAEPILRTGLESAGAQPLPEQNPPASTNPTNAPFTSPSSEQSVRRWVALHPITDGPDWRKPPLGEPVAMTPAWSSVRLTLAAAQERAADSSSAPNTGPSRQESVFSKDYWKLVGLDIKETFTAPMHWDTLEWLGFAGVAAGVGITYAFDDDIQKAVQRNRNPSVDDAFKAIEPFGELYAAGVLGGFYVGGELFHDSRAKSVALDGMSASLIASVLVDLPLKYGVGRSRPNKGRGPNDFSPFGGGSSFPSGHATEAFAVATVISEHYDSLWVKLAAYSLAGGVGFARINGNHHWASDVAAGAAIGTFVGHVVVRVNEQHRNVTLSPIASPDLKGLKLSWSF